MISLFHGLFLSLILFLIGLTSFILRRNILFILISLEIMMNAVGLSFIVVGSYWKEADGQIMYIFTITLAAAEASIALALLIQFYKRYKKLNIDNLREMNG